MTRSINFRDLQFVNYTEKTLWYLPLKKTDLIELNPAVTADNFVRRNTFFLVPIKCVLLGTRGETLSETRFFYAGTMQYRFSVRKYG